MPVAAAYTVSEVDTRSMPPDQAPDFWREHVRLNHGGLDFAWSGSSRDRAGFVGRTVVQRAGTHQLVDFSSDAISYVRSRRSATADDDRTLRVLVPRRGSFLVASGDGERRVAPGEAVAVSMAVPFVIHHGDGARAWVLSVPQTCWPHPVREERPRALDLRTGLGAVVATMTRQLAAQRSVLGAADFIDLSETVVGLLARTAGSLDPGRLADVHRAAVELVRLTSDDPDLTPAVLAERLGWSLRQLQMAARAAGTTPAALIRTTRLERARHRLRDPGQRQRTVTEVAHASGFASSSAFHAAFRATYDVSPAEARG